MLIVMTMVAQILPVRAIWRIVVVIAIPVMDSQQVNAGAVKLPATFGADRAVDFQRLRPII